MAQLQQRPRLIGRQPECDTLEQLLTGVHAGRSRVLVLRGEAGVGKSALLEFLAARASGCAIARAVGVEAEAELAYSGVHQLCAHMLGSLPQLPPPQREALSIAFGLGVGPAPDRFLVGLAVLGLLAESAEKRPLVCLVDDAQWVDSASARILAFVARRVLAERLALVFVVREPSDHDELRGLPELVLNGLGDDDSRSLLESALPGRVDRQVVDRIVAESRGNPLALLELPRGLAPAEVAGGFALPNAAPLSGRIEQSFVRRLQSLPEATRRLLLLAAAEPLGDVTLLWRAAEQLALDYQAANPAVEAGHMALDSRVRFRHPLVRSAIYRSTSVAERQMVHRALAEATDAATDPDRRAWHSARAATGPDEAIASELERSAERARSRGGATAAAAFLERATELTADPQLRGSRAMVAAQAKFEAAAPEAAYTLLASAEMAPLAPLQRAQLARLRARMGFAERRGSDAPPMLLDAARQLFELDANAARETCFEALEAAIFAGRLGGSCGVAQVAAVARAAPAASPQSRSVDSLLDGLATLLAEGHSSGIPRLRQALQPVPGETLRNQQDVMRWLALAPIAQEAAVHHLWDFQAWNDMALRSVRLARESGALGMLPVALVYAAGARLHGGDLAGASALIEEADAITSATRYAPVTYAAMVLVAWQGDEARALELMTSNVRDATSRGEGTVLGLAGYTTALLYNGLSRFEAALAGAMRGCEVEDFSFHAWTLAELVEAASRSGAHELAADALQRLEIRALAADTPWSLGILARSRALLAGGEEAEGHYRESVTQLERSRVVVHLARAHLLYGEWLRREGRRVDARTQLRTAYEMLSGFGADAFAERARRELVATGETVRKRRDAPQAGLTAQETQVARLAAEGFTNQEIGSQLFISHRTAEYHLHKVFAKLRITSRRELRAALGDGVPLASPV